MNIITTVSAVILLGAVVAVVTAPAALADHSEALVRNPLGSSVPGCETTDEGCFIPTTVTVDVGGTVTWTNEDTAAHTVTSGDTSVGPDGVFDSGLFMPETSFTHKFEEVGEFSYYCMVHPWMSGMVIVQEQMAEEPPMDEEPHEEPHADKPDITSDPTAVGALLDGTMVYLKTSEVTANEPLRITIHFDAIEHANYDIQVMQGDTEVLNIMGAHEHEGTGMHETMPLPTGDPVDITVTYQGTGINELTGPIGDQVIFAAVVPEFGTIAIIILAVSIVSIVAFSARSRISIIPRY